MNLNGRRIVVNNDFDGCLCARVLIDLYNCKVVGFSNSKDTLWFIDGEQFIGDEMFVDMFTPLYDSIDQHIHPIRFERSLSPNQERNVFTFNNYTSKYPFSTFIWILSIAARDGKDIERYVPSMSIGPPYLMSDIVLRADDSFLNYVKYNRNASDWEKYICEFSHDNNHIKRLFDFIKQKASIGVEEWKRSIDAFFCGTYGFKKEEIPDISSEMSRVFMKRFHIEFSKVTSVIDMKHVRTTIKTLNEFNQFYNDNKNEIFSFAFVYSPQNIMKPNFSYTLFKREP